MHFSRGTMTYFHKFKTLIPLKIESNTYFCQITFFYRISIGKDREVSANLDQFLKC